MKHIYQISLYIKPIAIITCVLPYLLLLFRFLLEYYSEELGSLKMNNVNFKYVLNVSIAVAVVYIADLEQLFIHKRGTYVLVVFLGILGSLSGAFFYNLLNRLRDAKST